MYKEDHPEIIGVVQSLSIFDSVAYGFAMSAAVSASAS